MCFHGVRSRHSQPRSVIVSSFQSVLGVGCVTFGCRKLHSRVLVGGHNVNSIPHHHEQNSLPCQLQRYVLDTTFVLDQMRKAVAPRGNHTLQV
jgi:hypothetical protein